MQIADQAYLFTEIVKRHGSKVRRKLFISTYTNSYIQRPRGRNSVAKQDQFHLFF